MCFFPLSCIENGTPLQFKILTTILTSDFFLHLFLSRREWSNSIKRLAYVPESCKILMVSDSLLEIYNFKWVMGGFIHRGPRSWLGFLARIRSDFKAEIFTAPVYERIQICRHIMAGRKDTICSMHMYVSYCHVAHITFDYTLLASIFD